MPVGNRRHVAPSPFNTRGRARAALSDALDYELGPGAQESTNIGRFLFEARHDLRRQLIERGHGYGDAPPRSLPRPDARGSPVYHECRSDYTAAGVDPAGVFGRHPQVALPVAQQVGVECRQQPHCRSLRLRVRPAQTGSRASMPARPRWRPQSVHRRSPGRRHGNPSLKGRTRPRGRPVRRGRMPGRTGGQARPGGHRRRGKEAATGRAGRTCSRHRHRGPGRRSLRGRRA